MAVSHLFPTKKLNKKLFNRNRVVQEVVSGRWIEEAIVESIKDNNETYIEQKNKAKEIFFEIANDMNFKIIRTYAFILKKFIWRWIFEAIEVRNFSKVQSFAEDDYQIVYVPNHRSHIDYLMMLDAITKNGLMPPVMAAGKNLNFFPAGYFLRKGCAFFVRRSLSGDKFYTAVLKEYISYLMKENVPLSFFPEGGRSRSGKLQPPKLGFFSFVVQSYLRNPAKKVVFIPAYISYDRVIESKSYEKELTGVAKKKESFWGFVSFFKKIRKLQGKAYLNFGEPLILKDFLSDNFPQESVFNDNPEKTLEIIEADNPQWYWKTIELLGNNINTRINESAILNVASVVSFALANTQGQKLKEENLNGFIGKMISIKKLSTSFSNISFSGIKTPDIHKALGKALSLKKTIQNTVHESLQEISVSKKGMSHVIYPLNNIFHLFAMEAFIAKLMSRYNEMDIKSILNYGSNIYPRIKEEFFLPWNQSQIHEILINTLDGMVKEGLLKKHLNNYSSKDIGFNNSSYLEILNVSFNRMFPSFQL